MVLIDRIRVQLNYLADTNFLLCPLGRHLPKRMSSLTASLTSSLPVGHLDPNLNWVSDRTPLSTALHCGQVSAWSVYLIELGPAGVVIFNLSTHTATSGMPVNYRIIQSRDGLVNRTILVASGGQPLHCSRAIAIFRGAPIFAGWDTWGSNPEPQRLKGVCSTN